jgi:uncharacterized surface protein with fasciclin (FAS1) repeats
MPNILDTAKRQGTFDRLVSAWISVGMQDSLSGGPYTVFAPTDRAFEQVPASILQNLEDQGRLKELLDDHIVSGRLSSSDVAGNDCLLNIRGRSICLDIKDGIRVKDARIIKADIDCSNGVIHAIDRVLLPDVLERISG